MVVISHFFLLVTIIINFFISNGDCTCNFKEFQDGGDVKSCKDIDVSCLNCSYNKECDLGNKTTGNCTVLQGIECKGERNFIVELDCYYCYQINKTKYDCEPRSNCRSNASPPERITVNCTVHAREHCFGLRTFKKAFTCNWTSGTRWSTAFLLSITLGGFGADRFYLGHWEEGLGKFFSFGGLGVWTLVDIVLVGIGYITPEDGSLYIF